MEASSISRFASTFFLIFLELIQLILEVILLFLEVVLVLLYLVAKIFGLIIEVKKPFQSNLM
jgi:hypothetical protein